MGRRPEGYDPEDLIIDRFGLNYEFILDNEFTWIDNLITGSGKNLASPNHINHKMDYVQDYLSRIGPRKCEANVIVTLPRVARALVTEAIENYVGIKARDRFREKREASDLEYDDLLEEFGIREPIQKIINDIDE